MRVPLRGWIVVAAGTAVNLCLGILYAWSVWKAALLAGPGKAVGADLGGVNAGWEYLSDAQATWAYSTCGFLFALAMIPGGRLQDRHGPRVGVTLGGLLLATGCVLAGLTRSYLGLVLGFGVLGGVGMGLAYAAATPAAVKWFGPHRRGLVVGVVVGGFGAAAVYIAPLARWLIGEFGVTGSFVGLGGFFALTVTLAGRLLAAPPAGYAPPAPPASAAQSGAKPDHPPAQMVRTWQFYALVLLFIGSAQSGLLVIANAAPMLNETAKSVAFLAANGWLLASFGGAVNAAGRVGTGLYSDRVGRLRAYRFNGVAAAACLFATPAVMDSGSAALLFVVVGVAYWQYGGGLALMPALTADYFGPRNLGANYGLVFLGWGLAFLVPLAAGAIRDATGSLGAAFYLSGGLLSAAVVVSLFLRPPAVLTSAREDAQ